MEEKEWGRDRGRCSVKEMSALVLTGVMLEGFIQVGAGSECNVM